jgi:hypothetical protein
MRHLLDLDLTPQNFFRQEQRLVEPEIERVDCYYLYQAHLLSVKPFLFIAGNFCCCRPRTAEKYNKEDKINGASRNILTLTP